MKLQDKFETISWSQGRDDVPRSGLGSTLAWTAAIRRELPRIFRDYEVNLFFDAPCGDWFWMQHVDLSGVNYLGSDISKEIVDKNIQDHQTDNVSFRHMDITSDPLPKADMMMCRDCLFHLEYWLRWAFLENFVASKTQFLLSTINHTKINRDVPENSAWRPFNPMLAPFNFPAPIEIIHETSSNLPNDWQEILKREDTNRQRSMGIWHRAQIIETIRKHKQR